MSTKVSSCLDWDLHIRSNADQDIWCYTGMYIYILCPLYRRRDCLAPTWCLSGGRVRWLRQIHKHRYSWSCLQLSASGKLGRSIWLCVCLPKPTRFVNIDLIYIGIMSLRNGRVLEYLDSWRENYAKISGFKLQWHSETHDWQLDVQLVGDLARITSDFYHTFTLLLTTNPEPRE